MSHLVSNLREIESNPIFNIPYKEIIPPQYKSLLNDSQSLGHTRKNSYNTQSRYQNSHKQTNITKKSTAKLRTHKGSKSSTALWKEEIMLMNFCNKLTQKQLDKIRHENEGQIRKQFSKLRKKLQRSAANPFDSVSKFFDGRGDEERLDTLLLNDKHYYLDIQKKHKIKITNKLFCLKQARQIQNQKENYRRWLDHTNNETMKSPNFRKMNFVLEKLRQKNNPKEPLSRVTRKTDKPIQNDKFLQMPMRKTQHSSYSPKSRLRFLQHRK